MIDTMLWVLPYAFLFFTWALVHEWRQWEEFKRQWEVDKWSLRLKEQEQSTDGSADD